MSSSLAYGSPLLPGDISASINQAFGVPESLMAWNNLELGLEGPGNRRAVGNLGEFIRLVAQDGPKEEPDLGLPVKKPMRQMLGVESPGTSPGSTSAHLSQSVLQITATSLRADALVVAVLHPSNRLLAHQHPSRLAETVIATPKGAIPEAISFTHEMIGALTGKVVNIEGWNVPSSLVDCIGRKPAMFQGSLLRLDEYEGVVFALWASPSAVLRTAPTVMANAVRALPLLLANRASARKSERLGRQFDAILKRMPQAVVFVDDELAQVVVNPAAAELLELPCFGEVDPVKVAGSMRHLAERSGSRSDLQRWFSMVAGTADSVIEEEWQLTDPRRVLRVQSYPVSSNVNAAHGRLWLFEDLTADRNAREAIAAANHAKSQFLAMMSHELRTPMTGVLGMLDLLKLTPMEWEQLQLLKVMQSSAEGLMTVINNILDFCKMEAGRLILEEIDFQVNDLLELVRIIYERELEEKQLQLEVQLPPPPHQSLRGDPVRLKQIVANLVSNAIKNTDHGSITVTWEPSEAPEEPPGSPDFGHTASVASASSGQWGRERRGQDDGSHPPPMAEAYRASSWPANELAGLDDRAGPAGGGVSGGYFHSTSRSYREGDEGGASPSPPSAPSSPLWDPLRRTATMPASLGMTLGGMRAELRDLPGLDSPRAPSPRGFGATARDSLGVGAACATCGAPCLSEAATSAYPMVIAGGDRAPVGAEAGAGRGALCGLCSLQAACDAPAGMARLRQEHKALEEQEQERGEGAGAAAGAEGEGEGERQWFRIAVTDTGCGMSEEQLRKVFEGSPAQAHRRDQGGTGLGLPICRGLLALMGGHMWAESEPGLGSTFTVLVPLLPAQKKQAPAGGEGGAAGAAEARRAVKAPGASVPAAEGAGGRAVSVPQDLKLKVLVAEDNKVNQLLIRKILKHYGHEVELVGNGKLALEAVQARAYDLVLMDLQMPILDGLTATRAIRSLPSEAAQIPIYALTADVMAPEIEEAGMDGFLSKPIVWDKLSHVVDRILAKKASSGQAA